MPSLEDADLAMLRTLDPAVADAPPAPGSTRYDEILRRATGTSATVEPATVASVRKGRSWRRPLAWTAAATAAAAAAVTIVTALGTSGTPANEVVLVAANTTAEVASLRVTTEVVRSSGRSTGRSRSPATT